MAEDMSEAEAELKGTEVDARVKIKGTEAEANVQTEPGTEPEVAVAAIGNKKDTSDRESSGAATAQHSHSVAATAQHSHSVAATAQHPHSPATIARHPHPIKASAGEKRPAKKNTAVFVTGLPEDTTQDELYEYFGKYGVIMDDMFTGGPRIKMYEQDDGVFKGEALIVYLREESVAMAIDLLDGSLFRADATIAVQPASFHSPDADANANADSGGDGKKRMVDKRVWKQHMQQMGKKLEWTANDAMSLEEEAALRAELRRREKHQRIVVLRGMFTAAEAQDVRLALDLKEELMAECERLGEVTAIHVLRASLLATVKFREKEAATACIKLMNGRYFDGRRITAVLYDGSFSLKEGTTDEAGTEQRLEKFAEWLEHAE